MFKKIKTFVTTQSEKIEKAAAPMLVAGAAMGIIPTVYATTNPAVNAITKVINLVFDLFKYIGIVLALWGGGSLLMAFKNEDADSKTRAIMSLVVGITLVSAGWLLGPIIKDLLNSSYTFSA